MSEQSQGLGWGEGRFEVPPDLPLDGSPDQEPEDFRVPAYPPPEESRAALERASGLRDTRIRDAQEAVTAALFSDARTRYGTGAPRAADSLLGVGTIQGVGAGRTGPGEGAPGAEVLSVCVAEPTPADRVRELVVDAFGVRAAADLPLRVVHSGLIRLQTHTHRQRPAPGGISVGHHTGVQGTLGFVAKGRATADANKVFLVSANHVIANKNTAAFGSCIVQPSPADGGRCPGDRVAILDRVLELDLTFTSPNYADCARAWCYPGEVVQSPSQVHIVPGFGPQLFVIGSTAQFPVVNTVVGKSGCITQMTYGRVDVPFWNGLVYDTTTSPPTALPFNGQTLIVSPGYAFSWPGDSGAVVWNYDASVNPVGLLIGGSPTGVSVSTPLPWVLDYLDVDLV
ncbi:hypothetical protein ACH44C_14230 [Streptomyces purpureus]|uniref:hypothetical protein n=1 Tax=Streptomyces purpureus TaxID=1951 RepID=UPI0037ADEC24